MGGPDATSDLLAYFIHKNTDGTSEVYKKIASDLTVVKKPTYGWGLPEPELLLCKPIRLMVL